MSELCECLLMGKKRSVPVCVVPRSTKQRKRTVAADAVAPTEQTTTERDTETVGNAAVKGVNGVKGVSVAEHEGYCVVECGEFFRNSVFPNGHQLVDEGDQEHSAELAVQFFEWMIAPVTLDDFYRNYWEKKPLLIKRHRTDYYHGWLAKDDIDSLLHTFPLEYGKHLDITKYQNGKRLTLNPKGLATPEKVWKFFASGCSVRMLHPQQYSTPVWKMLSALEEFWGCQAGCNAYLTPKNCQGFAPHFDDVEAFVLQTDGAKQWRLYAPRNESEVLPGYSSPNFKQDEIGKPIAQVLIETGDMLYFPRGVIHQAISTKDTHSLHLTISTALKNSWGDFISLALPRAIELAQEENVEFRRSLPLNFFQYMGVIYSDQEGDQRRDEFATQFATLAATALEYTPLDPAADQMAANFARHRLPPYIPRADPALQSPEGVTDQTEVRLICHTAARLVIEGTLACIYSPVNNKRADHAILKQVEQEDIEESLEEEKNLCLEFSMEYAPSLELLILNYPKYLKISTLPVESEEDKITIATELLRYGILVKKK